MHWKIKALIQNVIARLPSSMSHAAYYRMQRSFGALRSVNPLKTIRAATEIAEAIRLNGRELLGGTCLEVGTGRRLNLPILLWLMGAKRVVTVDLNAYLKEELVAEDIAFFQSHRDELIHALDKFGYVRERFELLMNYSVAETGLENLLKTCNIDYLAPADASRLPLDDATIDFHVSTNVFEHIPQADLLDILREANRVTGTEGLAVHRIDHSDHFSHTDSSLSAIHFLRYSENRWSQIAGNRYMYMNRLQQDDFRSIFGQCNHDVLTVRSTPDQEVLIELQNSSVPLDSTFANKSPETLATLSSLFVSRPQASASQSKCTKAA